MSETPDTTPDTTPGADQYDEADTTPTEPPPFIDAGPLPPEAGDNGKVADQTPTVDHVPSETTVETAPEPEDDDEEPIEPGDAAGEGDQS